MTDRPLRLSDDDFWDDPTKTKDEIIDAKIDANDLGSTIDLPIFVPLENRTTLPLVGIWIRTLREDLQIDGESQTLIAAVDLDTQDFRVALARDSGKLRPPRVPPERDPGNGHVGEAYVLDLRRMLDLPWASARYQMAVIVRERVSNPAQTELGPSMHTFVDEEVQAYVAQREKASAPRPAPTVWPPLDPLPDAIHRALDGGPDPYPNYLEHPSSPPLPEGEGMTITIDRVAEPGHRCLLRGSFRLRAGSRERVDFDPQTGLRQDVGVPNATAVLPINLIATGSELVGPWVLPLRVPTFDSMEGDGEVVVTGHFNLDLAQIGSAPKRPGTYFFYAFNGPHVVGPIPLGIAPPAKAP